MLGFLGSVLLGGVACGQGYDKTQPGAGGAEDLAQTSIILVKPEVLDKVGKIGSGDREKFLTDVTSSMRTALLEGNPDQLIVALPGLHGFLAYLSPAEARDRLAKYANTLVAKDLTLGAATEAANNSPVALFDGADCGEPFELPYENTNPNRTLPWLAAVNAPPAGGQPAQVSSRRVWVIDSGITPYDEASSAHSPKLTVDHKPHESTDCTEMNSCQDDVDPKGKWSTRDWLGHGSMVAGLIGAEDKQSGYHGVAPGVTLLPVKVFRRQITGIGTLSLGLTYVAANAEPGDVAVMSWGFLADFTQGLHIAFEQQVKDIADRGVRIAVAAGNVNTMSAPGVALSGYVQTVIPARLGGYRSPAMVGSILLGGGIWTTSAVDVDGNFWGDKEPNPPPKIRPHSGFGGLGLFLDPQNTTNHMANPDVAEPGVKIDSIWGRGQMNTCSGTSFAAAILAGLLVYGDPARGTVSIDDPAPPSDPIGVCHSNSATACPK